ncbi:MAG: ribonuclease H-like domain-containing protein [Thermodesulfobacteriota bacterium]
MLEHTFIHIPGIGPKTEQMLWKRGLLTWEDFLGSPEPVFPGKKDAFVRQELELTKERRCDLSFFADRLGPGELWRVYDSFKDRAVFLDIETSGGYQGMDEITVIGLYDGQQVRTFINGRNLEEFEEALPADSLLVTFNGSCFDLPYIKRWFRQMSLPAAHIDLRFFLKKIGFQGGLKAVEEQVGLVRDPAVRGLDGFDAVLLWKDFQWGNEEALERLILYNTMDIVQLKPLLEMGVARMKQRMLPGSE